MAGAGRAALGDQIMGNNHHILHEFCRGFSLCPRGHTVRGDHVTYGVFCLAGASHAERFCERFGGERFDPKDRGRGSAWFLWRKS